MARADTADVASRMDQLDIPWSSRGYDRFGLSRKELERWLSMLSWFYRRYFRVQVSGLEHLPPSGRVMLVGNHSGGVALDAAIVSASLFLELSPPRLAHSMADKFLSKMPFVGRLLAQSGALCGVPEHATQLLEAERALLVFPEGHRGTAKLYPQRHSLLSFGTGFMRLALATNTPIVPFAFLGGGDAIPTIANLEKLGKLLGVPYIPVTPYLVPLPRRADLDILYGAPLSFNGRGDEEDSAVFEHVETVRSAISTLIQQGEDVRRGRDSQVGK